MKLNILRENMNKTKLQQTMQLKKKLQNNCWWQILADRLDSSTPIYLSAILATLPSLYYCVKIFVLFNVSLYEKLHTTFQWVNWAKDGGSGLWNYTLIKSSILQISSTVPDEFIKISKLFQINKHSEHK